MEFFKLVLFSVAATLSVKNIPIFAEVGFSIIFFLGIATLFFFIPLAFIIAELSSIWNEDGGCYLWISKAYNKRVAFFVIWAYWMESIFWFPTMLIFASSLTANILLPLTPLLENNAIFIIFFSIFIFWSLTFLNIYGFNLSILFTSIGVIAGTLLPVSLIILVGVYTCCDYMFNDCVINYNLLLPNFDINSFVFFSGILLGISGIELVSFSTVNLKKPKSNIPKAIITSSIIIFLIYLSSALSIILIVPHDDLLLASGVIQMFKVFFQKNNIFFFLPLLSFFLLLGVLSSINAWILGPVRGLHVAAKDGFLPTFFKNTNKRNIPVNLLIFQAFVGSILFVVFFIYIKNVNSLFWIFICLSFQFASFLYIMIFFSILRIRKKYSFNAKTYKAPCVKILAYFGILMCIFSFVFSYMQPLNMVIFFSKKLYFLILFSSVFVLMLPSIVFILYKKE